MTIAFSTKRTFIFLVIVSLLFVVFHLVSQALVFTLDLPAFWEGAANRFNVDSENSVATWYAQILLLTAGFLSALIARATMFKKEPHVFEWFLLAAVFVYLSIDEATSIHELAIQPTQELLGIDSGLLFFAWFIPVLIIVGILGIFMLKWFLQLPLQTKKMLVLAFIIFVVGAVGMEMISGAYWQANDFVYDYTYRVFNAVEEGLEMIGVSVAIYALLEYAKKKKVKTELTS